MRGDDDFEPRLGRVGRTGRSVAEGRDFRNRVIKATNLARGGRAVLVKAASGFTGKRLGRGNGAGTVLASRGSGFNASARRVLVKARIVKLAGRGKGAAIAHMRYIQRDGVTRSGERGELYDAGHDVANGAAFLERGDGDRHQFRFIVSPEDGMQYEDLRSVTRRLMTQMETDLGTKLDWVAVDHFNTGHPHTHILVRGRDDIGKDLVIAPAYIRDGIRERASDILSFDLGPRSQQEIAQSFQREMTAERFTTIDKWLLERRQDDGRIRAVDASPERQSLITGRLKHLERLELATPDGHGHWRVSDDLEPALRQLGRRGDIIKSLRYDLDAAAQEGRSLDSVRIHDIDRSSHPATTAEAVTGRLVRRGLYDEIEDRHFVVIDGVDGNVHVIDIGKGENTPHMSDNGIVRVAMKVPQLKPADHAIAEVAKANGGMYTVDLHLKHDPNARQAFAVAHVRRLEAIRKATGNIERLRDGRFHIGSGYRDIALAYERDRAAATPVRIDVLSPEPVKVLERRNAFTWLDAELTATGRAVLAETGFGREVRNAMVQRTNWLIEEGLFQHDGKGGFTPAPDLERQLARREWKAETERLSKQLGKPFREMRQHDDFRGVLRQKVTLNGGQYALVERSKDFALVPWRDVLEKRIGLEVSGMRRGKEIDWSFGRERGLGLGL